MKLLKKSLAIVSVLCLCVLAVVGLASCSNNNDGKEAISRLSLLLDEAAENSAETGLGDKLDVPYSISINSKDYVVDYSTNLDNAQVNQNVETKTTVIAITQTGEEQSFTLTATVAKASKSWDFKVAAKDLSMVKTQAEIDAMENKMDYEAWAAAQSGDASLIQGYVTHAHDFSASYGNASVWLQDDNGGYYGYRVAVKSQSDFDEYFKTGNKIAIVGKLSPYNGWQEMAAGCTYYYISDGGTKTYDFKDVTSTWSSVASTAAEALAVQNQKIKVTGKVTSVPAYSASAMTVGLSVGGQDYNVYFKSNYTALPKDLATTLKVGYTVEVEGIAAISSKKAQICPISANAITVKSTDVTEQDKVNGAKAEVANQNVLSSYYDSLEAPIQLMTTTQDGCSVAYELSDVKGTGITLSDNALNVTVDPNAASSAKLTATITKEGAEKPATYSWTIATKTNSDVVSGIESDIKKQSNLTLTYTESTVGARQRLLVPTSPSSKALEYSYAVSENDGYITVGQFKSGQYYFDVKKAPAEGKVTVTLTCTFTYEGTTKTVNFTITLTGEPTAYEKYVALAKDSDVEGTLTGVVTSVGHNGTKTCIATIATSEGPIYVYSTKFEKADWTAKFIVGRTVSLTGGKKSEYAGLFEYVVSDLDKVTLVEGNAQAVTPINLTNLLSTSELNSAAWVAQQGAYASITGKAVVKTADDKTTYYLEVNGKQIQIYDDAKFVTVTLADHLTNGKNYTVTGIVGWYNKAQIIPVSADFAVEVEGSVTPTPTPTPEPVIAGGFTGVVTDAGFKDDTSKNKVRCFALVQNADGTAKYITAEAAITTTDTLDAIHAAWNAKFVTGKIVTVKGTDNDYNGLTQYVVTWANLATDVALGEAGTIPAFLDITAKVTAGDDLKPLQGVLVKVTGTCVVSGSDYTIQTADGKSILIYFDRAFQTGAASDFLKAGSKYTVSGFLNWYNNPQVTPIADGAVVLVEAGTEPNPTPAPTPTGVLASCTFNKAFENGFTYIQTKNIAVAWYSDGGLKLNNENSGTKSGTFAAVDSCVVVVNIRTLNENTKSPASADCFTIKGYNAAGEVVDTKTLTSIIVGDNSVTLTGTGIVCVEVIMTGYPSNGNKYCNVSLGGVVVKSVE